MNVLIDADIFTYRIGFACNDDPWGICRYTLDRSLDNILEKLCENGICIKRKRFYLTSADKSNFRFSLYDEYKANRKKVEKPVHYDAIRDHLVERHGAKVVSGMEADDALSIMQYRLNPSSVIVTLDKDLDMVPGLHYNFVKNKLYEVDHNGGMRWFCKQLLMGDTADNIPGIPKVGPKTAEKLLGEEEDFRKLMQIVHQKYSDHYSELDEAEVLALMNRNARLLWMLREPNEVFAVEDYL